VFGAFVIGCKNHWLTLQRPSGTSGYEAVGGVWGSWRTRTLGSPESIQAGAAVTTAVFISRIWYRTDVRADWRVLDENGTEYQINGYGDPDGKRRELELTLSSIQ
jgi:SPP1 family predicted phage head-tail adaptor